jgi:hypothetical protein
VENKSILIIAAIAGLSIGQELLASENHADKVESQSGKAPVGKCFGVNTCKGTTSCHTETNSCAGTNSCKGKGWIRKTEKDCKKLKGNFKV